MGTNGLAITFFQNHVRGNGIRGLSPFESREEVKIDLNLATLDRNIYDIVKSFMKSTPGTYRKKRETLPLRGGRERVGVKEMTSAARSLRRHSTDTEQY